MLLGVVAGLGSTGTSSDPGGRRAVLEAVCIGYKATGWMLSSLMMTLMWSGIIVCGEGGGWGWQLFCQFTPITYCYIDFNVGN